MLTELATLTIRDYLLETGAIREESAVRAEIAHNGKERPLFWCDKKVVAAVDAYLSHQLDVRHGMTTRKALFRGLDPNGRLFLRADGEPIS